MNSDIKKVFDNISLDYDKQRKKLIPCFEDFYKISVSMAVSSSENPSVLDIGAGTGLFSSFLLEKYPNASFTLIDISEKMLEVAKTRFRDLENIKFIADDYTKYDFGDERYDVIISALSIHHLEDEQKRELYKKCYSILNFNGIFINAEQVLGETSYLDSFYKKEWKSSIERSDLPKEEVIAGYERMKLDKEATMNHQLSWLKEAGFSDVDCVYKYYNFAVFFGRKIV